MAYFDDPAHKAQWEKELSALREEKQRRMNSAAAGGKKPQRENTVKLPTFEELVRQAALRHQNREIRRQPEAPQRGQGELQKTEASPRGGRKNQTGPTRGTERVRMTFAQLLAEEEKPRSQTVSDLSRRMQRTMEAGNAL